MAEFIAEEIGTGSVKFRLLADGPLTCGEVFQLWIGEASFRSFFAKILRDAPFDAYRWETPPVTKATLDREFQFVLIDCPPLARPADRRAFAEFFDAAAPEEQAIVFENLGRDATLVVPCPPGDAAAANVDHFAHLASFVRQADDEQVDAFWQLVGRTMCEKVGDQPLWLSTAGIGVAWLHVRLDQRPKYYAHRPYRDETPA